MSEVYGDLLFLINAGMDLLCLYITAKLLHRKVSLGRLLTASVLGGIYSVAALFFELPRYASFSLDIAVCIILAMVVFLNKSQKGIIIPTVCFVVVSMVVGGVMTAIYNLLTRAGLSDGDMGGDGISAWMFGLLAAVSGLAALFGGRFFRRTTAARPCKVEIHLGGKSIVLDAICDSGNLMRDPIGGRVVVAVEKSLVYPLIDKDIVDCLADADVMAAAVYGKKLKLRMIPASTAMGSTVLVAVVPDKMMILTEEGAARDTDALFAIISSEEKTVLVPSELLL